MNQAIDYSLTEKPAQSRVEEDWEPPPHKYFGPKGAKGKPLPEPVYVHQEYPRTVYAKVNGNIRAQTVESDAEFAALGDGWTKNLLDLGYIGAPSHEQILAAREPKREVLSARK